MLFASAGLLVSRPVRFEPLTRSLGIHMCDDNNPQPAAVRERSLFSEISETLSQPVGGMFLEEIRSEMVDAFVLVSGEAAPEAVGFGDKPMPTAEIGLEQLPSTSIVSYARARRCGLPIGSPPGGPSHSIG